MHVHTYARAHTHMAPVAGKWAGRSAPKRASVGVTGPWAVLGGSLATYLGTDWVAPTVFVQLSIPRASNRFVGIQRYNIHVYMLHIRSGTYYSGTLCPFVVVLASTPPRGPCWLVAVVAPQPGAPGRLHGGPAVPVFDDTPPPPPLLLLRFPISCTLVLLGGTSGASFSFCVPCSFLSFP